MWKKKTFLSLKTKKKNSIKEVFESKKCQEFSWHFHCIGVQLKHKVIESSDAVCSLISYNSNQQFNLNINTAVIIKNFSKSSMKLMHQILTESTALM